MSNLALTTIEHLPPEGKELDGIIFRPVRHEHEAAYDANGQLIGEIDFDETWQARIAGDEWWCPMRSQAEARAFLVSWHRNAKALIPLWKRMRQS